MYSGRVGVEEDDEFSHAGGEKHQGRLSGLLSMSAKALRTGLQRLTVRAAMSRVARRGTWTSLQKGRNKLAAEVPFRANSHGRPVDDHRRHGRRRPQSLPVRHVDRQARPNGLFGQADRLEAGGQTDLFFRCSKPAMTRPARKLQFARRGERSPARPGRRIVAFNGLSAPGGRSY